MQNNSASGDGACVRALVTRVRAMRAIISPRPHVGCNFLIEPDGAGLIGRIDAKRPCRLHIAARTLWRLRPSRSDRTCLPTCVSRRMVAHALPLWRTSVWGVGCASVVLVDNEINLVTWYHR